MRNREWMRDLMARTVPQGATSRQALMAPPPPPPERERLVFLGTGGNPGNLITQRRQTGGFYLYVAGVRLHVDPGPGAIVHALRAGLPVAHLDGVYVSHAHTDHVAGAAPVIEAMCRTMAQRRGKLLAPRSLLADGVISAFHQGKLSSSGYTGGPEVVPLSPWQTVGLSPQVQLQAVPVRHGPENYGFVLRTPHLVLGYTSDVSYLRRYRAGHELRTVQPGQVLEEVDEVLEVDEELVRAFSGVDVLVANVSFFHAYPARHLTAVGLVDLVRRARVGGVLLTHFDLSLAEPALADEVAAFVSAETGVPARAARDMLEVPLTDRQAAFA